MLEVFVSGIGVVASYAVMRYKVESLVVDHDHTKLQVHEVEVNVHDIDKRLSLTPSMEEVRSEFVSNRMLNQLEKHLDRRLNSIDENQKKMIEFLIARKQE